MEASGCGVLVGLEGPLRKVLGLMGKRNQLTKAGFVTQQDKLLISDWTDLVLIGGKVSEIAQRYQDPQNIRNLERLVDYWGTKHRYPALWSYWISLSFLFMPQSYSQWPSPAH